MREDELLVLSVHSTFLFFGHHVLLLGFGWRSVKKGHVSCFIFLEYDMLLLPCVSIPVAEKA